MDPRIISYPSVPGRMTQHQTNGAKLQECLYFKKSPLPKKEEMPLPLLPLKSVEQAAVGLLEEDSSDLEVTMIDDQEDQGAVIVTVEAVDHHLASANWHTPAVCSMGRHYPGLCYSTIKTQPIYSVIEVWCTM